MATRHNSGGGQPLPFALISQAITRLSRHDLEALTESLIDRLDALDPDPDIEPNGDELDGTNAEDDYLILADRYASPGCPISDPPEESDTDYCLASDDRGSNGPNAYFLGHSLHAELYEEPDAESWTQPVHLQGGNGDR